MWGGGQMNLRALALHINLARPPRMSTWKIEPERFRMQNEFLEPLPLNRLRAASPQPSPPQVCGGEGVDAVEGRTARKKFRVVSLRLSARKRG